MKTFATFLLLCVPVAIATGCGDDESRGPPKSDADVVVARVADTDITEADVLRIQPIIAPVASTDKSGKGSPPMFGDCIKASRKDNEDLDTKALRGLCKKQYVQNRTYAAGYLIHRTWAQVEARRRDVEPSKAEAVKYAIGDAKTKPKFSAPRERQALILLAQNQMRNWRLQDAFGVDNAEALNKALLKRYGKQTSCSLEYKKSAIPECNGSTQLY